MVTRPVQRHDEDLSEARRHDGNARDNHGSSLSWTRAVAATLVVASVTASFGEPSRAEDRPHAESGLRHRNLAKQQRQLSERIRTNLRGDATA